MRLTSRKTIVSLCLVFLIQLVVMITGGTAAFAAIEVNVNTLATESANSHLHTWITSFDATNHYEVCSVCGEKRNITKHSYTSVWVFGYESCDGYNYRTDTCSCGYNKRYKKDCVWDGKTYVPFGHFNKYHYKVCTVHGDWILATNYSYNGKLIYEPTATQCRDSVGLLGCGRSGTCLECKYTDPGDHRIVTNGTRVYCDRCNTTFGSMTINKTQKQNTDNTVTYTTVIALNLNSGVTLDTSMSPPALHSNYPQNIVSQTSKWNSISSSGATATITTTVKPVMITRDSAWTSTYTIKYNGISNPGKFGVGSLYPDLVAPTIEGVTQRDLASKNGWTTTKSITVSGSESVCPNIYVTIKDKATGKVIINDAATSVSGGKYSYTCTPNLEGNASGRTYTVCVTDIFGNQESQDFTVTKTDAVAPTLKYTVNTSAWGNRKVLTVEATDNASPNIRIGLGSRNNMAIAPKSGTTAKQEYILLGDVYNSDITFSAYAEDDAGNYTEKRVTISKLDNTKPTITNVAKDSQLHKAIFTVTANDKHTTYGNGSGVAGYAITTGNNPSSYVSSHKFEIGSAGNYTIFVKDNAGNIQQQSVTVAESDFKHLVTVDVSGCIYDGQKTFEVLKDTVITLGTPSKLHNTFLNWKVGDKLLGSDNTFTVDLEDLTVTPVWRENPSVELNIGGNKTKYWLDSVNSITLIPPANTATHYFAGWKIVEGKGTINGNVFTPASNTGNTIIEPIWKKNPVLTVIPMNGEETKEYSMSPGTSKNIGTPSLQYNQFIGWNITSSDAQLNGSSVTIGYEDAIVKANFNPLSYTIAYDGDGSDLGEMKSKKVRYGEKVSLDANRFMKLGYTFKGWVINGGSTLYMDGQDITDLIGPSGNITAKAVWSAKATTDENGNPITIKAPKTIGVIVLDRNGKIVQADEEVVEKLKEFLSEVN